MNSFWCYATSAAHLHGFYEELQQCEDSERLIWQLENLVESVVFDACQHERERLKFDEAIRKEREQHQEHLKLLEEELELQVGSYLLLIFQFFVIETTGTMQVKSTATNDPYHLI